MPSACRSRSRARPSWPDGASSSTSLAGSNRPGGKSPGRASRTPSRPGPRGRRATRSASRSSSARPSGAASRARATSILARIVPDGLVVKPASKPRSSRSRVQPLGPGGHHRALAPRGQRLVGAHDHRVGAELERVPRVVRVRAEMRAPGLVDDDRHAAGVGQLDDRRPVADRAEIAGLDAERARRRRVPRPSPADARRGRDRSVRRGRRRSTTAARSGPGRPAPTRSGCCGGRCAPPGPDRPAARPRARPPGWRAWSRRWSSGTSRRPRTARPAARPAPRRRRRA